MLFHLQIIQPSLEVNIWIEQIKVQLQKIDPYKCSVITEKKYILKKWPFCEKKLPRGSTRPVNEGFSTYSNIKTPLTELFTFFYTRPSLSASAIRASELAWEGERAERLFSRSGFISSLTFYSGAVTEVSLGRFVARCIWTYSQPEEWNFNTWVVSEPDHCARGVW